MGALSSFFLGVYSLKRKINISMDDLIILKHAHVLVCVCVCVCDCEREHVSSMEPPPLFACLE